jgi:surface antigen
VAPVVAVLLLVGATTPTAQTAYAAANCVNVVRRDAYWGQYRSIVESGWNAAGIGTAFARNGFAVNNTPSVGAIMVWPAGYSGASGSGHVGVVAAVNGNGTVLVRHENWPFGAAEHVQVFAIGRGHQFVHRIAATQAFAPAAEEAPVAAEEAVAAADVGEAAAGPLDLAALGAVADAGPLNLIASGTEFVTSA